MQERDFATRPRVASNSLAGADMLQLFALSRLSKAITTKRLGKEPVMAAILSLRITWRPLKCKGRPERSL